MQCYFDSDAFPGLVTVLGFLQCFKERLCLNLLNSENLQKINWAEQMWKY